MHRETYEYAGQDEVEPGKLILVDSRDIFGTVRTTYVDS